MFTLLGPSIKHGKNINILIIEKTLKITVSAGIRQLNRYDFRKKVRKWIFENIKENGKAFWYYVNSKTKVRSGIGDLKDLKSDDFEKANILHIFLHQFSLKRGTRR